MIDIHSHLLPGVDDGAKTISESLKILEASARIGITAISVSPHLYEMDFKEETFPKIHRAMQEVKEAALKEGFDIFLSQGYEVYLTDQSHRFVLNHHAFLEQSGVERKEEKFALIEMPEMSIPMNFLHVLFELKLSGVTPIIAHPERNALVETRFDILDRAFEMGALFQLDAGSILGAFGESPKLNAEKLLKRRMIHLVGSDVHNLSSRPVDLLHLSREAIGSRLGDDFYVKSIFVTNPGAVVKGKTVLAHQFMRQPHEPQEPQNEPWWKRSLRKWVA
ncbi:MAG: CpsB/CapC family capsule biosynthesis tyrosine phosphatase [Chloroherpetonaceae bacterium]|nr:CpsB/CapC family capsule biosynthesis tyrosine phosphatase [Chloroherpetonaceae bacterium]